MKRGLFELADRGTLFLDEIGELEPKVQVKLLRVLDGVPYYRLGGNKKVAVDVRVIAATNQDLEATVRAGRFRSDLYHRLGQVQLRIPPLRKRPEDLEAMADRFLQQHCPGMHFSAPAMALIKNYHWPGNVRELQNVVIQVSMVAEGGEIKPADLPPEIGFGSGTSNISDPEQDTVAAAASVTDLEVLARQTILRTLTQTGGHQGMAAEQLGISRRTLSRKLKQYNMNRRKEDGPLLGVLDRQQQHYFRAAIELPVTITNTRGERIQARTINISSGGLCVDGVENPLHCAGMLDLRFPMPESGMFVETRAQVAWADGHKKAGIRFVDLPADIRATLDRWLQTKQAEEGWTIAV
jgi:hypothetical protein